MRQIALHQSVSGVTVLRPFARELANSRDGLLCLARYDHWRLYRSFRMTSVSEEKASPNDLISIKYSCLSLRYLFLLLTLSSNICQQHTRLIGCEIWCNLNWALSKICSINRSAAIYINPDAEVETFLKANTPWFLRTSVLSRFIKSVRDHIFNSYETTGLIAIAPLITSVCWQQLLHVHDIPIYLWSSRYQDYKSTAFLLMQVVLDLCRYFIIFIEGTI